MSSSLSQFVDVKNVAYGPSGNQTAIGSVSNMSIPKSNKRAFGYNNNVVSGAVSAHITDRHYTFSFDTSDFSVYNFLNTPANQIILSVLSFIQIPFQTQEGTPLGDELVTLSNCIIDSVTPNMPMKNEHTFKVTGQTLATSDDNDPLTYSSTSS